MWMATPLSLSCLVTPKLSDFSKNTRGHLSQEGLNYKLVHLQITISALKIVPIYIRIRFLII